MDSDFEQTKKDLSLISEESSEIDFFDQGLLKIIEKEKNLLYGREKTSDAKRREKVGWIIDDLFDEYCEEIDHDSEKN